MIRTALLGTILLSLFARPVRAEEVKIGIVDLRRALAETDDGKKARSTLKRDFDKKQKELDEQQEEVKKAIEDLNKKRTLLPADTVRQKEAELQERVGKVQQTYLRHQQDLASKEEEATAPIVERLQRIIGKIAAAENFTVVLDKSAGVVFAKDYLDLTGQVIRRFNAGEEKAAPAPKKAAAQETKKK
jgi:outer membrane protein